MNILVPDKWLREFLITKATPSQIKEYLSLCGPSVERIHKDSEEVIYDIEVTSNRPDSMSILGIAREAAAILPRFGIKAELVNDPYDVKIKKNNPLRGQKSKIKNEKRLFIKTDSTLNPRWTSVVIDSVKVGPSPDWLKIRLEQTGIRPLNSIIDITNYIMRAYGQPVHAFDYDEVKPKNGVPTMILRASKKGERVITLDGKAHTLPGDDIVIEDGSGRLIDLCGIMGAENSSVTSMTKTIVLFMQTYEPAHIRRTSMALAHRTEAASLFEKGLDPELVYPSIIKGVELVKDLANGEVASQIYDIYHDPYRPYKVGLSREKLDSYMGTKLSDSEIKKFLSPLGLTAKCSKTLISVDVPSFRRDITIDVDIIEEIARIYGYHKINSKLPSTEPPVVIPDPALRWEEEVKIRLRDWGYTETYTYSMISEELMSIFSLDKSKAYKIANPLSNEWIYMRPSLWPSLLSTVKQNISYESEIKLFELSMVYEYREGDLPKEKPTLLISETGKKFYELKGLAEVIFEIFGINVVRQQTAEYDWYSSRQLSFGKYGSLGEVNNKFLEKMNIKVPVFILELDFEKLVADAKPQKNYRTIPKYPPQIEDITLTIPTKTRIGDVIRVLRSNKLVSDVELKDIYMDAYTFRIWYQDLNKTLTDFEVESIRNKILSDVKRKFGAVVKS